VGLRQRVDRIEIGWPESIFHVLDVGISLEGSGSLEMHLVNTLRFYTPWVARSTVVTTFRRRTPAQIVMSVGTSSHNCTYGGT